MSEFSVIITAGGIGKRMGAAVPKQFIEIAGKPILIHTLEKFYSFDPSFQLILTLPAEWRTFWDEILVKYGCNIPHTVVEGGAERYHSIKNALELCEGKYIAVHDGVRPLVSKETLNTCITEVKTHDSIIPVIPVKESIRRLISETSRAEDRAHFRLVQTPQCFRKEVLVHAYALPYHDGITDDASLVEDCGFNVKLVHGNEENIKITSVVDLAIAELFLRSEKE